MPTIEARITNVQRDDQSGWYRISTDDSTVKSLDTKIAEKAREAQALKNSGALALIDYTVNPKVNPHTNKPYPGYYERATESVSRDGDDGIEVVGQYGRKTNPEDAWRMCLNKGGELAVLTLPLMPIEQRSFEVQTRIATAWARFFFFTPPPEPGPREHLGLVSGYSDFQPSDGPPPHDDDDIPY